MMDYASGNDGQPANETMADIPQNRTLMVEQLTEEPPITPKVVHGLESLRQVFDYYKPEMDIAFTKEDGGTKRETLRFTKIEDFSVGNIQKQSSFLSNHQYGKDEYLRIITQLRTNKNLQAALADDRARKALLESINRMISELKNNL